MKTLQELTGRESGIVIYGVDGECPEAIICNWAHIDGYPRLDPMGFVMGLGEDIPEAEGIKSDDIISLLEDAMILYANCDEIPAKGVVYTIGDNIIIAPDGWS